MNRDENKQEETNSRINKKARLNMETRTHNAENELDKKKGTPRKRTKQRRNDTQGPDTKHRRGKRKNNREMGKQNTQNGNNPNNRRTI